MERAYNPSSVESKWQKRWEDARIYQMNLSKATKPYYNLVMFPYPSGDRLHIGHWYNFAPADSWGRYMRMKGIDVLEPMGFDAFGLPAENYAVKTGVPPATSISKNVMTMIEQLKRMGCMYDWGKMVNTSEPIYYRWTQWLFLEMYKHKLAYKKQAPVNFCPHCQTVLANEQVWEGKCERCETDVVQKNLNQWFWKITDYAQELLDGLETIDWPEKTKTMQRNWIGRSEGAEIVFDVAEGNGVRPSGRKGSDPISIKVFTTRQDTLFGATYLVLAPEHPLVDVIMSKDHAKEVHAYREQVKKKTELQRTALEKEKTGVPIGAFVINPATEERVPIWIADYVLLTYGAGAVMGVPGHDERDFAFARKFKLPMKKVVKACHPEPVEGRHAHVMVRRAHYDMQVDNGAFTEDGIAVNSGFLDGLQTPEAKKRMISWLEDKNCGRGVITYRLRDWLISRQRYWGAPIPIVYDPEGNAHPVPEEHLPWMLPTDVEFKPTGESPLTHSREFKARTEKIFGKGWTPEFDTMDTFVCSSFYYLMYLSNEGHGVTQACHPEPVEGRRAHVMVRRAHHDTLLIDPQIEKEWMPVTMYIGGPEHACMHLIYARFVMKALRDFGYVKHDEPFKKLVHQGLITNKGAKMSKSKGNVVSPDSFVERHGSDVFRMYLMFMGPFTDGGDWNDHGIKGIDRFVQRAWKILSVPTASSDDPHLLHRTIKRVTDSMEVMHFNTAISALMEYLNAVEAHGVTKESAMIITRLLAPLAPHLAEELWEVLRGLSPSSKGTVPVLAIEQPWPIYDLAFLMQPTMTIAIQVNGKLRGDITVVSDAPKDAIITAAKQHVNVAKYLEGQTLKKELYVAGKLVSFVV